jgi:hypothetical protein
LLDEAGVPTGGIDAAPEVVAAANFASGYRSAAP